MALGAQPGDVLPIGIGTGRAAGRVRNRAGPGGGVSADPADGEHAVRYDADRRDDIRGDSGCCWAPWRWRRLMCRPGGPWRSIRWPRCGKNSGPKHDHTSQRGKVLRRRLRPELCAAPHQHRDPRGRIRHHHGTFGGGQVDAAEHPRHAGRRLDGRVRVLRSPGAPHEAQGPGGVEQEVYRVRVSELSPDRQPDGVREPGHSAVIPEREGLGAGRHGLRYARPVPHRGEARSVSQPAYRADSSNWWRWRGR